MADKTVKAEDTRSDIFFHDSGDDPSNSGSVARLGNDLFLQNVDERSILEYQELFSEHPELSKSISVPPDLVNFNRVRTMPADTQGGKLVQWPGLQPATLYRLVSEHLAPQMIIGLRVDDVQRYSQLSSHVWRPGWKIELINATRPANEEEKKMIREAEDFIKNCGTAYQTAIDRDDNKILNFTSFLSAIVRNTLTYDGIAIWTDRDKRGRVRAFKPYSAGNVRLVSDVNTTGVGTEKVDTPYFACLVDDAYRVIEKFTREELVWYVRNPRLEADVAGYGYPEPEIAARVIQGLSNAIELNLDIFDKNSIPAGMLKLKGNFRQKDLDFLGRVWTNIKRGKSKAWTLPAVKVPTDGDIELLELSALKDKDGYYKEWINMMFGAFATVYRFPVHRLGYHASGTTTDTNLQDTDEAPIKDKEDPGLEPLLNHIETVINEYLLWSRYPELQFKFTGKSPSEDARQFQQRANSMTLGERRAASDLRPLWELDEVKGDDELERIAKIVSLTPTDTGLAGVYQSIMAAYVKGEGEADAATPGATIKPQNDPKLSEQHGHQGGIRRNSAAEKGKESTRGQGGAS